VSSFATSGDADLGEYDEEPVIILKAGRLPPPFGGRRRSMVITGSDADGRERSDDA
jgi:hypothetical protein